VRRRRSAASFEFSCRGVLARLATRALTLHIELPPGRNHQRARSVVQGVGVPQGRCSHRGKRIPRPRACCRARRDRCPRLGIGNLRSAEKRSCASARTHARRQPEGALTHRVVLPGVGAFAHAPACASPDLTRRQALHTDGRLPRHLRSAFSCSSRIGGDPACRDFAISRGSVRALARASACRRSAGISCVSHRPRAHACSGRREPLVLLRPLLRASARRVEA